MLVLSRKRDESIVMAEGEIVVTILEIRGDQVRLGISAPRDIDVHRMEIFDLIQRERNNDSPMPAEAACDVKGSR